MSETTVRPPAVAGRFYDASPSALRRDVERHLAGAAAAARVAEPVDAVVAPHAGYVYSGAVAGSAFVPLASRRRAFRRVVLVGPAHYLPVAGLALPGVDAFATPLGEVPVDRRGAGAVAGLPAVEISPEAHAPEHSLEVELPFLQVLLEDFEIVPILVGGAEAPRVAAVVDTLWDDTTLVVASSDLSHYHSYEEARRRDRRTAARIQALDATLEPTDACGAAAVNGLLLAAGRRGLAAEIVDLRNSGDTAGDRRRVVGYAAVHLRAAR